MNHDGSVLEANYSQSHVNAGMKNDFDSAVLRKAATTFPWKIWRVLDAIM